jgi:CubicO group peptidase (beta-lactamase class C family)
MHLLLSAIVLQTAIICTAVSNFKQQPFSHDSRTKILNARIDAAISSILKDFKTPGGVAVAVVQKSQDSGWRVETKGYSLTKVDGTRVTDDTLFAIGSNSNFEGRHFPYLQRVPR